MSIEFWSGITDNELKFITWVKNIVLQTDVQIGAKQEK